MAITRYTLGTLEALKTALEATGLFNDTQYDDDTTPTNVLCYDEDDHLIFEATSNSFKAYKSGGTYISCGGSSYGVPTYLYTFSTQAAVIHLGNAKANASTCIVMGKTNTGTVGFAFPRTVGATSVNADVSTMSVAAWDDPDDMTSLLTISGSTPMEGNSTEIVHIPMHGAYGEPEYIEDAFFIPMAQSGMRSLMQEIVDSDGKSYLTNGWVAVLDGGES
ncbi:MAG: hypothetical protein IJL32_05450 [Oscillospiraceae bacterium]|nr:hypothetical protein [Oscillospiraceae bacterium]